MKRLIWLIPIIAVLSWFLLKDVVYRAVLANQSLPDAEAATYLDDDGWLLLPNETPPGAWTEPWGVDLFIVSPPSSVPSGLGTIDQTENLAVSDLNNNSKLIASTLASAGPSYSPFYRHPSAVKKSEPDNWTSSKEDLAMAFERYLYSKNNWRGVLLVAAPETANLIEPIIERISKDPRLLERFGGVVLMGPQPFDIAENLKCSPAMKGNCVVNAPVENRTALQRWFLPSLHRAPVNIRFSDGPSLAQQLSDRNMKLSAWLDENAPKPAEPLGGLEDMEVIDIAPIRKPGETDEFIAEQELRTD